MSGAEVRPLCCSGGDHSGVPGLGAVSDCLGARGRTPACNTRPASDAGVPALMTRDTQTGGTVHSGQELSEPK